MSANARQLRQTSTDAERRLWSVLRNRQLSDYKFRRQHPIGPYVADFACTKHHLIIEADGGQHQESAHDERRDAWLARTGWRVLRFWNDDIRQNPDSVASIILDALRYG
jgi:very-short-patch-repair endonuclease